MNLKMKLKNLIIKIKELRLKTKHLKMKLKNLIMKIKKLRLKIKHLKMKLKDLMMKIKEFSMNMQKKRKYEELKNSSQQQINKNLDNTNI